MQDIVRFRNGRLEFSLNTVGMVVVFGGILLALACAYKLGRASGAASASVADAGRQPGADPELDVEAIKAKTPDPGVLYPARAETTKAEGPLTAAPGLSAPPQAAQPTMLSAAPQPIRNENAPPRRPTGLNHIWIERFRVGKMVKTMDEARQQAEKAQKWLKDRAGLDTFILQTRDAYELVTVQGFKFPAQKEQCLDLQEKILGLGKLYSGEGHGYLFINEARLWK